MSLKLPLPQALQIPLRDFFRGVSTAAELTEDAFRPASQLLPDPVKKSLLHLVQAVEDVTAGAGKLDIDHEDIRVAADFLSGVRSNVSDANTCASVVGFAWGRLNDKSSEKPPLIFSESLAAAQLQKFTGPGAASQSCRGGAVFSVVMGSNVIGIFPGTPVQMTQQAPRSAELSLFSTMVWLLATREETLEEELRLLDMASALTAAFTSDITCESKDSCQLDAQLRHMADHL